MTEVISNVEYSILRALGTDADFLYDTVDSYIKDAQSSNRSRSGPDVGNNKEG